MPQEPVHNVHCLNTTRLDIGFPISVNPTLPGMNECNNNNTKKHRKILEFKRIPVILNYVLIGKNEEEKIGLLLAHHFSYFEFYCSTLASHSFRIWGISLKGTEKSNTFPDEHGK